MRSFAVTLPRWKSAYLPVAILLLAFTLRLLVFNAILETPQRFLQPDSYGYHNLALNLLEHHRFGSLNERGEGQFQVNRTPGYPAFLAVVYGLLGPAPKMAIGIQILISTLTVAMAYRLGIQWGGKLAAVVVAFLMSIEVGSVIYANQLMTETLFNFVFLTTAVMLGEMLKRRCWILGGIAGVFLGLSTLVRPVTYYFGIYISILTLFLYPKQGRRGWLAAASIFMASLLIIAPWLARNYAVTGRAEMSTIQAKNLLFYNVAQLRASQQGIPYGKAREALEQEVAQELSADLARDPGKRALYYQQKALSEIADNWRIYIKVHLKGSLLFFVVPTSGTVARTLGWVQRGTGLLTNLLNRGFASSFSAFGEFYYSLSTSSQDELLFFAILGYELLYLSLVNIGMLLGSFKGLMRGQWRPWFLGMSIIGYFSLITGPVSYDARYRIPVMPFIVLIATFVIKRQRKD